MSYPYRYYRLAWQVILENFDPKLPIFKEKAQGDEAKKIKLNEAKFVLFNSYPSEKVHFDDEIEQQWAEKTFIIDEQEWKYEIKGTYHVDKQKGVVGIIIEQAADLKPEDNADYRYAQEILNKYPRTHREDGDVTHISGGIVPTIPFKSLSNLLKFAIKLLDGKQHKTPRDTANIEILDFIRRDLNDNQYAEHGSEGSFYKKLQRTSDTFWEHKEVLSHFANRKFLCFQRTDGCIDPKVDFGIACSAIHIQRVEDDACTITMHCDFAIEQGKSTQSFTYEGLLGYDASIDYLVAELKRKGPTSSPGSIAYFFIRLPKNNKPVNNELYVGYHVYYSITAKRMIVKTVVLTNSDLLLKSDDDVPFTVEEIGQYVYDTYPTSKDGRFEKIPLLISRFLAERNLNRLTLPYDEIGMLYGSNESLESWMIYQKRATEDKILKTSSQHYHVFYYYGTPSTTPMSAEQILSSVRIDSLTLNYDIYSLQCNAVYIHRNDEEERYFGKATRHYTNISVVVDSVKSKHKTSLSNIVHLSFSIPLAENVFAKEFKRENNFEGIISGLNDNGNTPISFVALVKKAVDQKALDAYEKDKVTSPLGKQLFQFFQKHQGQLQISVKPTVRPSVYELQTLIQKHGYVGIYRIKSQTYTIINTETENPIISWENQKDIEQAIHTAEQTMRNLLEGILPKNAIGEAPNGSSSVA